MKRLGFCALLFGALVSIIAAQSQPGVTGPERASARPAASAPTTKTPVAPRASGVAPIAAHRTLSAAEAGAPAAMRSVGAALGMPGGEVDSIAARS